VTGHSSSTDSESDTRSSSIIRRNIPVFTTASLAISPRRSAPVRGHSTTNLLRLLEEAGFTAGAFDADDLFRLELDAIRITAAALFNLLKPLVGERPAAKAPESKVTYAQSPEYHTGSSQYASATLEAGSNSSLGSRRMSLGPSGAAMLKARSTDESEEKISVPRVATSRPDRKASTNIPQDPVSRLETSRYGSLLERTSRSRGPSTGCLSTSGRTRCRHGVGGIARSPRTLGVRYG
jgi:hypothetical protein